MYQASLSDTWMVWIHQALPSSVTPARSTTSEWSNVHPAGTQPHSACLKLPLFSTGIRLPAFQR